jgi:excisionase family DNA binding protein
MSLPDKDLFRVGEVAQHWRVTERTIRRWVRGGRLCAILLNKSVRIPREAVTRFEREGGGRNTHPLGPIS